MSSPPHTLETLKQGPEKTVNAGDFLFSTLKQYSKTTDFLGFLPSYLIAKSLKPASTAVKSNHLFAMFSRFNAKILLLIMNTLESKKGAVTACCDPAPANPV
ncbi:MAG: hypothetical protein HWE23_08245 [Rhodobacteraceae bacterium]|nr:hypothetical protein [Paracoccaceae bacterium]